jgi:hypothetical protein
MLHSPFFLIPKGSKQLWPIPLRANLVAFKKKIPCENWGVDDSLTPDFGNCFNNCFVPKPQRVKLIRDGAIIRGIPHQNRNEPMVGSNPRDDF